jgi:hypothetical protein
VGAGVRWSADRTQAWRLKAGTVGDPLSLDEAAAEAARMGLPVPEVDYAHTRPSPPQVSLELDR